MGVVCSSFHLSFSDIKCVVQERESERERERETDRQTETERDRDRETETDKQTERERERERETERERDRDRQTDRKTEGIILSAIEAGYFLLFISPLASSSNSRHQRLYLLFQEQSRILL